jgi:hypothetical protein
MNTIRPFDPRVNYTRFHNYLLDVIMPELRPNSWKLLCFIVRKTTGWHKDAEQLSYSQLRNGTGIKSDPTLSAAIKDLVELGYITILTYEWEANTYSLNTTIEITVESESTIETIVEPTIEITVSPTIETIDTKRKDLKKGSKENTLRAQKDVAHREPPTLFELDCSTKKPRKTKLEDSPEEKSRKARTKAILDAYIEVRGKNGINYGIEGNFAKKIDKDGYTPLQVKGCYLWLKNDPSHNGFWEFKTILLSKIFTTLPDYCAWLAKNLPEARVENTGKKKAVVLDVDWSEI